MTRAKQIENTAPATEEEEYDLTEEQEAFIEASLAEIERGAYVDADEMLAELRHHRVHKK